MEHENLMAQSVRILGWPARIVLPAVLMLFFAAPLARAQGSAPLYGQFTIKPFKIIGNVYSVGLSNNTSWLITTPQGHFLIDATIAKAPPEIKKNIEQLGFKTSDIKYILQSHAHSDHVAGIPEMKEFAPDAKIPVMEQDAAVLADGGRTDYRSNGRQLWTPVKADMILHDGDKLELGGVTMVAHLTAGHTKGCTTWTTVAEENGKKYNVVFNCSMRMNPRQPLLNNPKYPNLATDLANAFKTLHRLPCDVLLASHTSMFDFYKNIGLREVDPTHNPFINPAACQAFIRRYEGVFKAQLAKEKAGGGAYAPTADDPTQVESSLPCPSDGRTCFGAHPLGARGGE